MADVFDVAAERVRKEALKERVWRRKRAATDDTLAAELTDALADPDALSANVRLCRLEEALARRKLANLEAQAAAVRAAAVARFGTTKRYTILYADPPWRYASVAHSLGAERYYATMSLDELAALPVAGLAAEDAVLVMWTTFHMLEAAVALFPAWGFRVLTVFCVWVKVDRAGNPLYSKGIYTMPCAEFALLGVRGSLRITQHAEIINSVVRARPRGHSRKPPAVRDMIVRLFGDYPRIELFARTAPPDWAVWGNQTTRFANDLVPDYESAEPADSADGFLPRRLDRKRQRTDRVYRVDVAGAAESLAAVTVGTSFGRLHAEFDAETQTPAAWRLGSEDHDHDGTLPCCRPLADIVPASHLRNIVPIRSYLTGASGTEAIRNTLYQRMTEAQVRAQADAIRRRQEYNADLLYALNNNNRPRLPRVRVAAPE